ncbi:MAG: Aldo/keto reductase family protein [Firmicutes bacterium]|nr:Aldo/keto reductase family protein [Bacillota bacterium]
MQYNTLGRSELKVSRLCFGSLTVGPLQANLPLHEGAAIIKAAFAAGVNFIDTAHLYSNYHYIREAIQDFPDTIVSSKSYDYTYQGMQQTVETACNALNRDYIDIFMLHEQVSRHTLRGHKDALDYLCDAKAKGIVRAVGVSTHAIEVVNVAATMEEIDVIHPILNQKGIGIIDGSVEDMLTAIQLAVANGKGIYTMKALGGGHLISSAPAAIDWILAQDNIHSVAVGMQTLAEVTVNTTRFSGCAPDDTLVRAISKQKRRLLIEDYCSGCGTCVQKCPMKAMTVIDGQAFPDKNRCVLCGYCGAYCPEFCIKVI